MVEALEQCHREHPIAKWWGACNEAKIALDKCFKVGRAKVAALIAENLLSKKHLRFHTRVQAEKVVKRRKNFEDSEAAARARHFEEHLRRTKQNAPIEDSR